MCVRVAGGQPQRIRDKGQQHLPGDEVWLIDEHRTSEENRHALMTMIAYAFLQDCRLKTATGRRPRPALPAVRPAILDLIARPLPQRWPALPEMDLQRAAA